MKVSDGLLVSIFYRITGENGEVIDQVLTDEPLVYRHGSGQLPQRIESRLTGLEPRQTVEFSLTAVDCFGEYEVSKRRKVPLEWLANKVSPAVGGLVEIEGARGWEPTWIRELAADGAVLDGNDALAGRSLYFTIGIAGVERD